MSQIYQSLTQLVGNTPLLEVSNIEKELGLKARVVVKLEYFNPGGSVKDRVALAMINDAEEEVCFSLEALLSNPPVAIQVSVWLG